MRPLCLWFLLGMSSTFVTIACSNSTRVESAAADDDDDDDDEGRGGTTGQRATGRGGSTGTSPSEKGGSSAEGGSQGAGGTKEAGGSSGTGGAQGKGGADAKGGSTAAGGSSAAGGTARDGGSDASEGGPLGAGGTIEASNECNDMSTDKGSVTNADDNSKTAEISVTGKTKSYQLHSNWWFKPASQVVEYDGLSYAIRNPSNTSVSAQEGRPTGFPTLFIGTYAGHATKGSNLPKKVTELTTVPTVFSTNALSKEHSQYNAAYDVWLTAQGTPIPNGQWNPGVDGAYLMVWLYKPGGRQPRGGKSDGKTWSANYPGHSVQGVQGSWDVWIDPRSSTDATCISYVNSAERDSLEFDLNQFIQDAVKNNYGVTSSMYLSIVFAGFEVWANGDGLQLKKFCAKVN